MTRLRVLRRWFARKFGYARLVCLALLIGLAALRVADPAPVEELRVRTFDTFQHIEPRVKTARPVTIVDIDEKSLAKLGQLPGRGRGSLTCHQPDPVRRVGDRFRHRVLRSRTGSIPDARGRHLSATSMRQTRDKLRALPSNDQVLADAIKQSRVVLGEIRVAAMSFPNSTSRCP